MKPSLTAGLALLAAVALTGPVAAGPGLPTEPDPEPRGAAPGDEPTPQRIEGTVLAVDVEHGRLSLATKAGVLALHAEPEDIADLKVGDTIEVVLVEDDFDAPATSPGAGPEPAALSRGPAIRGAA